MEDQYELVRPVSKPLSAQEGRKLLEALLNTLGESKLLSSSRGMSVIVPSLWVGNRESFVQRYEERGLEVICKPASLPLPGSVCVDSVYCITFRRLKK
ncbi:MAG: hypothetical protein KJ955_08925 [Nanoarchaeota archaeon]|nr:hypothetical protein [Nanoarchaeota archaeon]